MILDRLLWAALGGLVAIVVALAAGRIGSIPPWVKVWLCRLAAMKFIVGLAWTTTVCEVARPTHPGTTTLYLAEFLVAMWLAGLAVVARGAAVAWREARSLRAHSTRVLNDEAVNLAKTMGIGRIEVRTLAGLAEPCVVGVTQPCVILPAGGWSDTAVLVHELAHIRHRDLLWNAMTWSAYAMFWFVPGFGRLVREATLWQEAWADALARRETLTGAGDQASKLLDVLGKSRASWAVASFSGEASHVARRIEAMFVRRHSSIAIAVVTLVATFAAVPIRTKTISAEAAPIASRVMTSSPAAQIANPSR